MTDMELIEKAVRAYWNKKESDRLMAAILKTGEWKKISPARIYECSECGQMVKTGNIGAYKFCHGCGARMIGKEE